MKQFFHICSKEHGFTLIECIVAIVLSGLLGTFLMVMMEGNLKRSSQSIIMAQGGWHLSQVVEKMTSDYKHLLATDGAPLDTLKTNIGILGAQNNGYGVYTVVKNDYIDFDSSNAEVDDTSANQLILKVTVSKNGQSLTTLFTQ